MTTKYKTNPTEWSHERQMAQLHIEQAQREMEIAYGALWRARWRMKEAGVTDEGLAQVSRALHEASGWGAEEFMPDFPVEQRTGEYFDDRYLETNVPNSQREIFGAWLADHFNHRQFKRLTIEADDRDDLIGRTFRLRWTFWNDGRVGHFGDEQEEQS